MGALIRDFDWSATSLGPIDRWPSELKSTVSIMLPSKAQIVLFWGPEYVTLYNDAYVPTIGDKHPKALGRPARESWSELWSDLEPMLARVLETGETVEARDRAFHIERRGYLETVYFDISYSPVHSDDCVVCGVLCIVNETTDRILTERELTQSQERLSYALSAAGMVGTFDTDLVTGKVYADARFAEMYSVDPATAESGMPLAAYMENIHPDDVGWVGEAIQDAVKTGRKCVLEYRVVGKNGTVRWVEVHGQCLFDDTGKPQRMPGLAVDITKRKRAEMAVGSLAAIVSSSDDAIIGVDTKGIITSWNGGAEALYGYGSDEVIGRSVTMLLPDDRSYEEQKILAQVGRGEHVDPYETIRRRKDGSNVDVSLSVSPVRDAEGRIVGASKIARDITSRKESDRLRRTLMNEMRHRLQNTLATVIAIARQTFRDLEGARAATQTFEERLQALSKGHSLLTREDWDSVKIIDVVAQSIAAHGGERFEIGGPDLRLTPTSALGLTLVLHELSTNAAKYGALSDPSGRVMIHWEIEGSEGAAASYVGENREDLPCHPLSKQALAPGLSKMPWQARSAARPVSSMIRRELFAKSRFRLQFPWRKRNQAKT